MRCSKMSCFLSADLAVAGILEDDVLRVGKLLVVVEEVLAAQAGDRRGMRVDAQAPAGDVDVVHAVVAHVAACRSRTTSARCRAAGSTDTAPSARARATGRSRASAADRSAAAWPIELRSWLFQALATSTSPIAPSCSCSIASWHDGPCCGSACRPARRACCVAHGLDHQPALRGCCAQHGFST